MNMIITAFEGQLATTPETGQTTAGLDYCTATVLINRHAKNPDGTWVNADPTHRNIKGLGHNAKHLAQLAAGTTVVVIGTIETETWTHRTTGEERTAEVVVIIDSIGQGLLLPRPHDNEHITITNSRSLPNPMSGKGTRPPARPPAATRTKLTTYVGSGAYDVSSGSGSTRRP